MSQSGNVKVKKRSGAQPTSPAVPTKPTVMKHFCQKPNKHALAQVMFMCRVCILTVFFVVNQLHFMKAAIDF